MMMGGGAGGGDRTTTTICNGSLMQTTTSMQVDDGNDDSDVNGWGNDGIPDAYRGDAMDYMTRVVKEASTSPMVSSVPNKKHTAASPLFQDSDTSEDKNNNNNAAPTKFIFSQVTKHSCVNDNVKEYTDRMRKRMVQQPHEPSHITVKDFQNKERVVISETSSATAAGKEKKREDKNSHGRREEISSSPVLSPSRIKTRFLGEGGEMHSSRGKIGPQVFHLRPSKVKKGQLYDDARDVQSFAATDRAQGVGVDERATLKGGGGGDGRINQDDKEDVTDTTMMAANELKLAGTVARSHRRQENATPQTKKDCHHVRKRSELNSVQRAELSASEDPSEEEESIDVENGLFFRPDCTSLCITKSDSADRPCHKGHTNVVHASLNSAGDYVLFPATTFHRGYYNNQVNKTFITA